MFCERTMPVLLGGLKRREVIQFRDEAGICPMSQQKVSNLDMAFDQAGDQRRSQDLWVLVVRIDVFNDVMLHQAKVAIYGCLVQVLPVSS